jgi:hypothetical protein
MSPHSSKLVYEAFRLYQKVSKLQYTHDVNLRGRCYCLANLLYARYERRLLLGYLAMVKQPSVSSYVENGGWNHG